jgi:hypothetical protein
MGVAWFLLFEIYQVCAVLLKFFYACKIDFDIIHRAWRKNMYNKSTIATDGPNGRASTLFFFFSMFVLLIFFFTCEMKALCN